MSKLRRIQSKLETYTRISTRSSISREMMNMKMRLEDLLKKVWMAQVIIKKKRLQNKGVKYSTHSNKRKTSIMWLLRSHKRNWKPDLYFFFIIQVFA